MRIENLFFRLMGVSCHAGKIDDRAGLQALQAVIKLLSEARSSIKIVAGESTYEVYTEFLEVFEQAGDECTIEIVAGPEADERSVKALASLKRPVSFYQLDQRPPLHFVVVDKEHVRLEEAHPPGQKERVQYIVYHFEGAERLGRRFDELKEQANAAVLGGA